MKLYVKALSQLKALFLEARSTACLSVLFKELTRYAFFRFVLSVFKFLILVHIFLTVTFLAF